jgi:hypothetical protein
MSDTDKTRPAWVQFHDPTNWRVLEEHHDHRHGVCNFDEWLAGKPKDFKLWWRGCCFSESYYGLGVLKPWPKPPRRSWDRYGNWGRVRAQWRQERSRLLHAVDPEDVEYGRPRRRELTGRIMLW